MLYLKVLDTKKERHEGFNKKERSKTRKDTERHNLKLKIGGRGDCAFGYVALPLDGSKFSNPLSNLPHFPGTKCIVNHNAFETWKSN